MFTTFFESRRHETAFSLLTAAASWTANKSLRETVATSFRRCSPLIYTLPCRLRKFCELTSNHYGSAKTILEKHSLFNFFAAGMSPLMSAALEVQLTDTARFRTVAPRLPIFLESGNRFGLECPECSIEIKKEIGRRITTCEASIPFSTRCAIHGCRFISYDPSSRMHELSFVKESKPRQSNLYSSTAVKIANLGGTSDYRKSLTAELLEKGYLRENGRILLRELREDMEKFFADGFEDARLNFISQGNFCDDAIHKLHRHDRAIHPVHLTLIKMYLDCTQGCARKLQKKTAMQSENTKVIPQHSAQVHDKRFRWTTLCDLHPTASRTEVRMLGLSLWTWLYRHDKKWLLINQSAVRPRGDHRAKKKGRLPNFAHQVFANTRTESKPRDTLPSIRSAYKARMHYGLTDYAVVRISEETGAVGRFAALPGERYICSVRRLYWAINKLRREHCILYESEIARSASLRASTIAKIEIIK